MTVQFDPSAEQKAIIEAGLVSQRVIACAGSGKTATAVRRVAEIRRLMGASRQFTALLAYSNVAVETFRAEYAALTAGRSHEANRVLICTVDSFITSQILSPHAQPVMQCARRPYLVRGHEPFLKGFTFFNGSYGEDIRHLSATFDVSLGWQYFNANMRGNGASVATEIATAAIKKLGAQGAYTHDLGRFWALKTLAKSPHLVKVLAHRYPYILVDEAQDIGTVHGALIELLIAAGSKVSLVGDPNQAIYDFANADGSFLRDFEPDIGGEKQTLTLNRRSIQPLVDVANRLGGTSYKSARLAPSRKCGSFLISYGDGDLANIRSTFAALLASHGYTNDSAAILCRARDTVQLIAGAGEKIGQGATRHFASAAICRDKKGDIADAFSHVVDGVLRLLSTPPPTLRTAVLSGADDQFVKTIRRLIWGFLRTSATGLPISSHKAKSMWLPNLKANLDLLLSSIEGGAGLARNPNWTRSVTVKELADAPLWKQDLATLNVALPEVKTVHQSKGQSIDAVLYLLRPKEVGKVLAGPINEDGKIGYVGLTRAKDLLLLAVPSTTKLPLLNQLKAAGFTDWK